MISAKIYPPNLLDAMLRASKQEKLKVFQDGELFTFSIESWRKAAEAAGSFRQVAPKIARAIDESNSVHLARNYSLVLNRLQGILT